MKFETKYILCIFYVPLNFIKLVSQKLYHEYKTTVDGCIIFVNISIFFHLIYLLK